MKIFKKNNLVLALACFLGISAVASAVSVETHANFLTEDEIQYFKSVDIDEEEKADDDQVKFWGAAVLDTSISKRLHKITGTRVTPKEQNEYRRSIAVTKLTGTTETHADYHYSYSDSFGVEKAEDKVAFIFLETNPDATFVHGKAKIPSEAGKLVVFDGGVPHNTQVERGTLSLAGPLDIKRLSFVGEGGGGCTDDDQCGMDEECDCGPDPVRRLGGSRNQERKRRAVRKLDEIHEREQSAAARSTKRGFEAKAQSHRRAKGSSTACEGICVPKSSKSSKSSSIFMEE